MVRFGTSGIRGAVQSALRPETAVLVARAVAADASSVVVGRDSRTTSEAIYDAVIGGVLSGGATVEAIGLVPTSALAYASRGRVGIMVTASHNPPTDNGLKVFSDGRELDRESERRVEADVADGLSPVPWDQWGTRRDVSVIEAYRMDVLEYLAGAGPSLDGLRVAVDCGTGTAMQATPPVIRGIGGTVTTVNGTPDGHFPARPSEPTPDSIAAFGRFVAAGETELGVAHDGDADRIVVVGPNGQVIHEDTVTAVLAACYVDRADVDDPVVIATSNASARIDALVEQAGGSVTRVPLGRLLDGIAEADGAAVFAAEPWKHVHPEFGPWIDGIASAGLFAGLVARAGGVEPLVSDVDEIPYLKTSLACPTPAKVAVMETMAKRIPEAFPDASLETRDGIRASLPDGSWLLVRPSGTEPKVRLYVESEDAERVLKEIETLVATAIAAETD